MAVLTGFQDDGGGQLGVPHRYPGWAECGSLANKVFSVLRSGTHLSIDVTLYS